ncbi:hypothetical protein N2152v2_008443 [Parachlorella kessleri]
MVSRCGGRGSLGGLAATWQRAANDIDSFLQASPGPSLTAAGCHASPRTFSSTSAPVATSSEPQRADEAEALPHRHCWQCGSGLGQQDLFFCPQCSSIQPPDHDAESTYFTVFGMDEPRFDLRESELEQRYKQLQRLLHPDKFSTGSQLEREYSDQQLQQRGLGACEGLTITDPELLMYVMEAREEVEGTTEPARLQQLLDDSRVQEQRCVQELVTAFQQSDFSRAAEVTTHLRYVKRIQEAIIDKL